MLDNETKRRIDTARDILVGKVPDPKSQVEQITIALIYKFMDDMDAEAEELGGKRKFFSDKFADYSWKKLLSPSLGGHEVLNLYAEAIDKMNVNENIPQLFRDIFKNAYLPYRDPETLKSFLKIIDYFNYDHSEKLGDAFEYLLSVLGSQGDAGQFRTPRNIIDLMVYLVDPKKNETILDPACGTAGFLISSYKHIVKNNSSSLTEEKENNFSFGNGDNEKYNGDKLTPDERKKLAVNIQGYDISPDMVRLSLVNLYLHGFTNPKIVEYDTLTSEDKWNEHADIILANPPFMSPKGGIKPHKRFSVESSRSEVLFVDYIAEHLTPNGRAAVIVPEGIIFQSGTAYKALRKMLVEKYLYAVVSLPAGVFNPYSGVKTSILLMDKTLAKRTDKILFAKIENDGFDLGAQRRANSKSELPAIANAIKEYVKCVNDGREFNADDFTNLVIATKEKIGESGNWNLSGERYKTNIVITQQKYNVVHLSEICDVRDGTHDSPKYQQEGFPLITSKNIKNGVIDFADVNLISKEDLDKINQRSNVDDGDIIMPMIGTIGNPIIVKKDRDFAIKNVALIKFHKDSLVDRSFIKNILASELFQQRFDYFSNGSTQKFISLGFIRNLLIPLPPLEIQKEIVAEIEGWQKIINGARQVVENYKPQIQIDPSWEMVLLEEYIEFVSGLTLSIPDCEEVGGVPIIAINNVSEFGELNLEGLRRIKLPKQKTINFLKKGDLLFNWRNGSKHLVGKTALFDLEGEFVFASFLLGIRPKKEFLLHKYLWYLLNIYRAEGKYLQFMRQNVNGLFNREELKILPIPLPPIEKQKAIIERIEAEQKLVNANKELITIFEQKIKEKIASVWGE
ncbi:MAG: N-6 DNA methylase [Ignavibacteriaceae bacterium]|jgi:type I restriction enzyme M protein